MDHIFKKLTHNYEAFDNHIQFDLVDPTSNRLVESRNNWKSPVGI